MAANKYKQGKLSPNTLAKNEEIKYQEREKLPESKKEYSVSSADKFITNRKLIETYPQLYSSIQTNHNAEKAYI